MGSAATETWHDGGTDSDTDVCKQSLSFPLIYADLCNFSSRQYLLFFQDEEFLGDVSGNMSVPYSTPATVDNMSDLNTLDEPIRETIVSQTSSPKFTSMVKFFIT